MVALPAHLTSCGIGRVLSKPNATKPKISTNTLDRPKTRNRIPKHRLLLVLAGFQSEERSNKHESRQKLDILRVCLPLPKAEWPVSVLQGFHADFWAILDAYEKYSELLRHRVKWQQRVR